MLSSLVFVAYSVPLEVDIQRFERQVAIVTLSRRPWVANSASQYMRSLEIEKLLKEVRSHGKKWSWLGTKGEPLGDSMQKQTNLDGCVIQPRSPKMMACPVVVLLQSRPRTKKQARTLQAAQRKLTLNWPAVSRHCPLEGTEFTILSPSQVINGSMQCWRLLEMMMPHSYRRWQVRSRKCTNCERKFM